MVDIDLLIKTFNQDCEVFTHINTFHNLLDIVIRDRGDTEDLLEIPKSTLSVSCILSLENLWNMSDMELYASE